MAASSGKNTRGSKGPASYAKRKVRLSWRNRLKKAGELIKASVDAGTITQETAISTFGSIWRTNRREYQQHRRNWRG